MGWQLFFILWMVFGYRDYYVNEVYSYGDIIFQVPGYLFIFAMVITSFHPVRRKMNRKAWRVLHWTGIYFLWYVVADTYRYELFYYDDRQIIDYIYAAAGLTVFVLRIAAWVRLRWARAAGQHSRPEQSAEAGAS